VRTISREVGETLLTPQRPHAELLVTSATQVEAYLQGALKDGTRNDLHKTFRFGQSDRRWLEFLRDLLGVLGRRGWIYKEGRERNFWVLETTAPFLSTKFVADDLVGTDQGLDYVRGYFDAEGGMPKTPSSRLYLYYGQKDRKSLETVMGILSSWSIEVGRIHNPSQAADPDYWRFYIRAASHQRFMSLVGSWHPRKRALIETRMKIWSTPHGDVGTNVNKVAVPEGAAGSPPF
jgi:hypothetical protein